MRPASLAWVIPLLLLGCKERNPTTLDGSVGDGQVPQTDGIAFTEALRGLPYDPIVIWMTAYDSHTMRPDAERLGVHRCLDKPLEVAEIRQIVSETLWGSNDPLQCEAVAHG